MHNRATLILLNIGHALDHMFLLIFATAVSSMAADLGVGRWEDLMPYSVWAFLFFGLGSIPAGRMGDLWGRRQMMLVFFFGIGAASMLVAATRTLPQLALALAILGCTASIYHPVGIPMLMQEAVKPGWTIGVNGLSGNLGLAVAAVATGFLVKHFGWRMAFILPGLLSILLGLLFAYYTPNKVMAPRMKKTAASSAQEGLSVRKLLLIMTVASTSGSMLFNFAASSNFELLSSKFTEISRDPAQIGFFLAVVYVLASLTQLLVGHLLDRVALKTLYRAVIAVQFVALVLASLTQGWVFYLAQLFFMAAIFGGAPFSDAMLVRFVDDSMRSRVSGMRLGVALGSSSLAVWLIGPIVKTAGFASLLGVMIATCLITWTVISFLPDSSETPSRPVS